MPASWLRLPLAAAAAGLCAAEAPFLLTSPERSVLHGVHVWESWPSTGSSWPPAAILLFHGCANTAATWFEKPEEARFVGAAQRRGLALLAFTTPRHAGNFCWPGRDADGGDFEAAAEGVRAALVEAVRMRQGAIARPLPLLLVGGSSGGTFLSHLILRWASGADAEGLLRIAALASVVSPTGFDRELKPTHPPTAFVYMPRDTTFASEANIAKMRQALGALGVPTVAWAVAPRPLTVASLAASLRGVGIATEASAAERFCLVLAELGLVDLDSGELLEDPRHFPWSRALGALGRPGRRLREAVEELLNRAWAQHEFAGDVSEELLDWLQAHAGGRSARAAEL